MVYREGSSSFVSGIAIYADLFSEKKKNTSFYYSLNNKINIEKQWCMRNTVAKQANQYQDEMNADKYYSFEEYLQLCVGP